VVVCLLVLCGFLLIRLIKEIIMGWKNIFTRAVLTFLQAGLAVLVVTGVENLNSWDSLKPAGVAAVAALLSFVYNVVNQMVKKEGA
jgi:peptidoglycan/LPS O-acetylase OafA/YrhL